LTLNVAIIGLVGGAIYSFKRHDGPPTVGSRPTAPFVHALSHEDKRTVGRAIRKSFRAAAVDRQADHQRYQEALRLLRQTPLDEAALGAALVRLDEASVQRRIIARESFLIRLAAMSDAERAAYADRLEAALKRGTKRGHHKKHGPKTE
jgi:uncharacterized membrane protein